MGLRGQKPKEFCIHGHSLTDKDNVAVVQRKKRGKVYTERQCLKCRRKRGREWARKKRAQA